MATFLFEEAVFGPIKSRRLGNSIGINLLSTTEKICNYDCIYCECGWTNKTHRKEKFVQTDVLFQELEGRLRELKQNKKEVNYITYAGNGEPTLHPNFLLITKIIFALRNQYFPNSKIALLSNGSTLNKKDTLTSFEFIDDCILKIDAGSQELYQLINCANVNLQLDDLCTKMETINEKIIVQTMFLKGSHNQVDFDNTIEPEIGKWMSRIAKIKPRYVQLYSIARDTPAKNLKAISKDKLKNIAISLAEIGIHAEVY